VVKPVWIAVAFVAGIAVGIVATRTSADAPVSEAQARVAPGASREEPPAAQASQPADRVATQSPAEPAGSISAVATPASPTSAATTAAVPTADTSAVVQPIDAGEVFNKVIAQPSHPGFENNIGEAHRALERETRDDGWAYTMEAEIQNAMINEVSTGAFRSEHVECRATMCELRLSGKGDQAAAIKRWSDELGSQPFGQRLFLNYSSSISDNDRVDTLMIFRRPPKK
jgi:hypothetical protein